MKTVVLVVTLVVFLVISPAYAEWLVTDLNPAGAQYSEACGVFNSQQVGYAIYNDTSHAGIWNGTAASWIDLHPEGAINSGAYGNSDGKQAGSVILETAGGITGHASMWNGTAASWIDLHPEGVGASSSIAYAVSDWTAVGCVQINASYHASMWNGTATSWIDLSPAGAGNSIAQSISEDQQGGYAEFSGNRHAGIWNRTASSWVDLNPAGAIHSEVFGVFNGKQVGYADFGSGSCAGMWSGTAESWMSLQPLTGAFGSIAFADSDEFQVGFAWTKSPWPIDIGRHAGIWSGTTSSWVDLHSFLPSNISNGSMALGIDQYNDHVFVVGHADTLTGVSHAVVWKSPTVPESSSLLALCGGIAGFLAFRRRRK